VVAIVRTSDSDSTLRHLRFSYADVVRPAHLVVAIVAIAERSWVLLAAILLSINNSGQVELVLAHEPLPLSSMIRQLTSDSDVMRLIR